MSSNRITKIFIGIMKVYSSVKKKLVQIKQAAQPRLLKQPPSSIQSEQSEQSEQSAQTTRLGQSTQSKKFQRFKLNMLWFKSNKRQKTSSKSDSGSQTVMHKELLDMQQLSGTSTVLRGAGQRSKEGAKQNRINSPLGIDPKAMAKAAAARIDAIEQEIALDLRGAAAGKIGMHPRANDVANRLQGNRIAPPKGMVFGASEGFKTTIRVEESPQLTVMPEAAHTLILGDTNLAAVIDVKEINMAPVVEEAAVLYANDQMDAAIAVLLNSFDQKQALGPSEFNAYRMLFDLLRYKDDSSTFDRYAIDFTAKFEKSPPAWVLPKIENTTQEGEAPVLNLGEMLDADIVPVLEQLKVVALRSKRLCLDVSNITHVNYKDGFGCELLLRVMNAFEHTEYALELVGAPHLFQKLKPFVQVRRRDISGHIWLLYLELLRLQRQQLLFEDLAMKFAALYEISPPSWREPSAQLQDATTVSGEPKTIMVTDRPDLIQLSGVIKSNSDALINQIAYGLHESPTVVCDCRDLRAISFEAAGRLLTALTAWSAELKTVEFKNLNNPIATLFVVLGIQHLAVVERRRES